MTDKMNEDKDVHDGKAQAGNGNCGAITKHFMPQYLLDCVERVRYADFSKGDAVVFSSDFDVIGGIKENPDLVQGRQPFVVIYSVRHVSCDGCFLTVCQPAQYTSSQQQFTVVGPVEADCGGYVKGVWRIKAGSKMDPNCGGIADKIERTKELREKRERLRATLDHCNQQMSKDAIKRETFRDIYKWIDTKISESRCEINKNALKITKSWIKVAETDMNKEWQHYVDVMHKTYRDIRNIEEELYGLELPGRS